MSVTIWHNPRCSKSRQTLALLEERGVEITVVKYLETPPNEAEIRAVLAKLNRPLTNMIRCKDAAFKELGLSKGDQDSLISAMAQNPAIIERPVVITDTAARLGRPPEDVLDIL